MLIHHEILYLPFQLVGVGGRMLVTNPGLDSE